VNDIQRSKNKNSRKNVTYKNIKNIKRSLARKSQPNTEKKEKNTLANYKSKSTKVNPPKKPFPKVPDLIRAWKPHLT
jgi:hypothetical protein